MKLHWSPRSPFVRKVMIVLYEAGIAERESRMRASQLWNWIYVNGVTEFDRMTNIGKGWCARRSRWTSPTSTWWPTIR